MKFHAVYLCDLSNVSLADRRFLEGSLGSDKL